MVLLKLKVNIVSFYTTSLWLLMKRTITYQNDNGPYGQTKTQVKHQRLMEMYPRGHFKVLTYFPPQYNQEYFCQKTYRAKEVCRSVIIHLDCKYWLLLMQTKIDNKKLENPRVWAYGFVIHKKNNLFNIFYASQKTTLAFCSQLLISEYDVWFA